MELPWDSEYWNKCHLASLQVGGSPGGSFILDLNRVAALLAYHLYLNFVLDEHVPSIVGWFCIDYFGDPATATFINGFYVERLEHGLPEH